VPLAGLIVDEAVLQGSVPVQVRAHDQAGLLLAARRVESGPIPRHALDQTLWDRGLEMAAHKEFPVATDVKVYFCDPQSRWQRGTNENTNRLLRQYWTYLDSVDG
jgi:IS30 family transposase